MFTIDKNAEFTGLDSLCPLTCDYFIVLSSCRSHICIGANVHVDEK